jgi:hypothetical protein
MKMKIKFAIAIALFISFENQLTAQTRGSFGFQFSPGVSLQTRSTPAVRQINASPQIGFKTGFFYLVKLNDHFNFETSLNYSLLRNRTTSKTETKGGKYKFGTYHSGLQLTSMFEFQTEFKDKYFIKSALGASVNYLKKDDFYFQDMIYTNSLTVLRNWNYQFNSGIGIMKKDSKIYYGIQLDLGMFINYTEHIQMDSHQAVYWIKSSSAFFVIKRYLK